MKNTEKKGKHPASPGGIPVEGTEYYDSIVGRVGRRRKRPKDAHVNPKASDLPGKDDSGAYVDPIYTEPLIPDYLREREMVIGRWNVICRNMEKILLGPGYFPGATLKEIDDTLYKLEQMCLTFRQELEEKLEEEGVSPVEKETNPENVRIREPLVTVRMDGSALVISSPATLIRSSTHSWYLAKMTVAAIRRFENEYGAIRDQIHKPVYIIVKRKDKEYRRGYRDNENLETSKMINEIFKFLYFSDRPTNAGYTSLFEIVKDEKDIGTEITIFSKKDLPENWKRFTF